MAIIRDGRPRRVTALIPDPGAPGARPSSTPDRSAPRSATVHPQLEGAVLADAPDGGVLVRAIEPRSPAAAAQLLRAGDRIEAVNRRRVPNLDKLHELARRGGPLVLTVRRGNAILLIPLRMP